MTYTISTDVLAAHLAGEAVLLNLATKGYYRLNDTAAVIWKGLQKGIRLEALVQALCAEFEVEPPVAEQELKRLLAELTERGLVVLASGADTLS